MRSIDKKNSIGRTRDGWNRHLRQSERKKKYAILRHQERFGPSTKFGRRLRRERMDYVVGFFKQFHEGDPDSVRLTHSTIHQPENFCFLEYPEESLHSIWRSVCACLDKSNKKLVISHARVKRYNLTSEALLGVGIDAAEQFRRVTKKKIRISGYTSADKDHKQLLSEIGIVNDLKAQLSTPLPYATEKQHLFSFKSLKKSVPTPHSEDDKTIASEKLTEHVNECIRDHKLELTKEATKSLMKSVSEVLDNAERHCSLDGNTGHFWHARGYLNSHSEHQNFEISIFNFGATIASTFLALPENDYSRKLVEEYADAHSNLFDQEQLITVAALQQRYSCKNRDSSETNGQGTVVLIQFFEQLCEEFSKKFNRSNIRPRMSIVSGRTYIVFDGTYKLSQLPIYTENEDDEQLIIAFNQQNSLKSPPDPKYVRKMYKAFFPGVAISIRFPLKEDENEH